MGTDASAAEKESLKNAKMKLTKTIKQSKEDEWCELCRLMETDLWGRPFNKVMGKLCKNAPIPGMNISERMESIVEGLFSTYPGRRKHASGHGNRIETSCEYTKAIKAPGPVGKPNEILMKIVEMRPGQILDMFNKCITQGTFPATWKTARLVIVRKGNKPLDEPSSYQPLCKLNTTGKLFEKIIDNRIRELLETNNCLTDNQHGFRRVNSTVGAATRLREIANVCRQNIHWNVGLLTLDIRDAFNFAPWTGIIEAATGKKPIHICKLLDNYFCDRNLTYEVTGKVVKKTLTAGYIFIFKTL